MYGGASLGTYDAAAYRSTAATRFREALQGAGISVQGGTGSSPDFEPPAGTTSLLTWRSPPLSSMAVPINGCTYGGSAIQHDVVAAPGLFLEFGNNVSTTRIQNVSLVRHQGTPQ